MPETQQKLVKVDGIGVISFPEDMPDGEVNEFIKTQLVHIRPSKKTVDDRAKHTHWSTVPTAPLITETSEHARQNPNEGPALPWPGLPHLGQPVERKENWWDKNLPYGTGMAQFVVGQIVGVSKIARLIDAQLGITKPLSNSEIALMHKRIHRGAVNKVQYPQAWSDIGDKANDALEQFAAEGPSNKEEVRGQVIANLLELDLGEKSLEWTADALKESNFLKVSDHVKNLLNYIKEFKAIAYGTKMAKRTMAGSFLSGLQTLFQEGGDTEKAIKEAKTQMKIGVMFEAAGLGTVPFIGKRGVDVDQDIEEAEHAANATQSDYMDATPEEQKLVESIKLDEEAEAKAEQIDNYAQVGAGEDPLHHLVSSPETETTPPDQMVVAGKKTRDAISMGDQGNSDDLSDDDKKRLDELRRARMDLDAVVAALKVKQ